MKKIYLAFFFILYFFNIAISQKVVSEFPYSESFEKNTFNWITSPNEWKRVKNIKENSDSGIVAKDGEYFLTLQNKGNLDCTLISPTFFLSKSASSQFSFSYNVASSENSKISLFIEANETNWTEVWSKSVVSTGWQEQPVDLSQFAGESIKLRIQIICYSKLESSICIDNIEILSFASKIGNEAALLDRLSSPSIDKTLVSPISSRGYSFGNTSSANQKTMQLKSTSITPDSVVNVFNTGNYDMYQYTIEEETTEILNARRSQDTYSIFQVNAPESSPYESTLALMNELGTTGAEFMDLYNMSYPEATQFGIRLQKRGTGAFKPFVIDFDDGITNTKVFQTESNQYSTFFGGLGLVGNFFSIKSSGDGYTYAGIELKSSEETTSKLWQIVHKQDIPNALSFNFHNGTSWTFPFMILGNGHILAGTFTDSGDKVNVNGTINAIGYKINGSLLNVNNLSSGNASTNQVPVADGSGGIDWQTMTGGVWTNSSGIISYNNGDVSIGTNVDPHNLYTSGKVYASEVLVQATVPIPDYVFDEDYNLRSLQELKKFIEKNKHLPEIPSADEVGAKGVDLGKMNLLLLKKVEELTLYILRQEEKIEELETKYMQSK